MMVRVVVAMVVIADCNPLFTKTGKPGKEFLKTLKPVSGYLQHGFSVLIVDEIYLYLLLLLHLNNSENMQWTLLNHYV